METLAPRTADLAVTEDGGRDDAEAVDPAGFGFVPRTELGRLALAARRAYHASEQPWLTREEINREVAERRGGTHLLDDE